MSEINTPTLNLDNVSLTLPTKLETLLVKYKEDVLTLTLKEERNPESKLNINRKDVIARQIQQAFSFLRFMGKPYSEMTLEEFEVAHEEVKSRTQLELTELRRKLSKVSFLRITKRRMLAKDISNLEYKLKYGYNSIIKDNKFLSLISDVGKDGWDKDLPPNYERLVNEIFEQKFIKAASADC